MCLISNLYWCWKICGLLDWQRGYCSPWVAETALSGQDPIPGLDSDPGLVWMGHKSQKRSDSWGFLHQGMLYKKRLRKQMNGEFIFTIYLGWFWRASPWLDVPGDSLFTLTPMERLSSLGSSTVLPPTEALRVGKSWFKVSWSVLGNCYSCKHTQRWSGKESKGQWHQKAHQSTRKTKSTHDRFKWTHAFDSLSTQ